MILPKIRDPRFITVRRGGSLRDDDHHLLAVWAARFSLGPQLDGWRLPMAVRVLGVVALAPLILLAILITIDLRSNG